MIILVMGVSGVGKTTVGQELAKSFGATFLDADDFHSAHNIAKMRSGQPLTDDDRADWLDRLNLALGAKASEGTRVVLACSALKRPYRRRLLAGLTGSACVLYLRADFETIRQRLTARRGHFMPTSLLTSQFDALEEPSDAVVINAAQSLPAVVAAARQAVEAHGAQRG